jgi:hypothetical protein
MGRLLQQPTPKAQRVMTIPLENSARSSVGMVNRLLSSSFLSK